MSNARRKRRTERRAAERKAGVDGLNQTMSALDGAHIPGGCDHCDAYQVIRANQLTMGGVTEMGHGVHTIEVHHDDDCPVLLKMQRVA